jgi:hypothetical protein
MENEKKGRLIGLGIFYFFCGGGKPKEGRGEKWKNQT